MNLIARQARFFLKSHRYGILSTISVAIDQYPYGAVCPYVLDERAQPVILISTIAQHTKNIKNNNKVSLTVMDESLPHRLEGARVSLLGDAVMVPPAELPLIEKRYRRYFPEAQSYFQAHDFEYHRIEPVRIRYIEGFAKIYWIERDEFGLPLTDWASQEEAMVQHMNTDHQQALKDYCRQYAGLNCPQVNLLGIDPEGFDVRTDQKDCYFPFSQFCSTKEQVRSEMMRMARDQATH